MARYKATLTMSDGTVRTRTMLAENPNEVVIAVAGKDVMGIEIELA